MSDHYQCGNRIETLGKEIERLRAEKAVWVERAYKEGWKRGYEVGVEDRTGDGPDPWCDADWDGSSSRRALRREGE